MPHWWLCREMPSVGELGSAAARLGIPARQLRLRPALSVQPDAAAARADQLLRYQAFGRLREITPP
jgi:hypothetical protein